MGIFGDDDDNSGSNDFAQQQINQNEAQLEAKRKNLFETRLAIVKSDMGMNWTPEPMNADRNATANPFHFTP